MKVFTCGALLSCCFIISVGQSSAAGGLPAPLVYLTDVDPSIRQEIRYASDNNFTGARVPGYEAAECILTKDAAEALRRVQADLAKQFLGLKVYDCYRPKTAVRSFVVWAGEGSNTSEPSFYPRVKRRSLIEAGYIAAQSGHSTGAAVDLTLVRLTPTAARSDSQPEPSGVRTSGPANQPAPAEARQEKINPPFGGEAAAAGKDPHPIKGLAPADQKAPAAKGTAAKSDSGPVGECTGPAVLRGPDDSVDMGTGYDCFDPKAHTRAEGLSSEQQLMRATLVSSMSKHGFRNYKNEWWHFTHESTGASFDVPVSARIPATQAMPKGDGQPGASKAAPAAP